MNYHPVTTQIVDLLKSNGYWHETFEHEPVRTSEEAAKVRHGYLIEQGAKALIVRAKTKEQCEFIMLVMPAQLRLDTKKAKQYLQTKDLRFATEEEVSQTTNGVQIGGVPPFGNLFNLKTIVDPKLFLNEKIVFNAGDRRYSVAMLSQDYKNIVNPEITDIV
ncbi:MAG: YbaK/EbsC family protein [Patescibacteria group bacterium]